MGVKLMGADLLTRKLHAATGAGKQAVARALVEEAETIITASKQQYVPVDTAALKNSGFVQPRAVSESRFEVTLGFGGPAAPYAVIVHEDLTKRHTVGQAKYLEIPLRARVQGMRAVLRQRASDAVRQSVQRLAKVEANVGAGRSVNWGMPLFRGGE